MFSKTLSNWSTLNVKQQLSIDCIIDALGRPATIVERLYSRKSTAQYCFLFVFCWVMNLRPAWTETKVIWTWIFVESEVLLRLSTIMQCALLGWVICTMSRIWNWERNLTMDADLEIELYLRYNHWSAKRFQVGTFSFRATG